MPETTIDLLNATKCINKSFLPLMLNKDRWLFLYGGAGSGKSYFIAAKLLIRILKAASEGRKHRFLCLRKTQPAARKSIFALFLEYISEWGLSPVTKINKTDMTISLFGSEIVITGLDDQEKIKSIQGITGIWLEEVTEFTQDDFQQLDLRLRGNLPDYKQIIASFNPIDEQHWIRQKLFGDDMQAKIESGKKTARRRYTAEIDGETIEFFLTVHHSTYRDNEFIDKTYKAQLESLVDRDKNYYNIYCLGRWGSLKGLIFDKWEITRNWPENPDTYGYGIDFGFSIDPSTCVEVAFVGRDLYLREILYETQLTNQDIAERIKPVVGYTPVVCDSAEPKSIVELKKAGIMAIASVKGKDSVLFGIQTLKQYNIKLDYNSTNLIKEFQSYKWAENKDGQLLSKPVDYMNHLIDPARYIVTHLKGRAQPGIEFMDISAKPKEFNPDIFIDDPTPVDIDDESIWEEF